MLTDNQHVTFHEIFAITFGNCFHHRKEKIVSKKMNANQWFAFIFFDTIFPSYDFYFLIRAIIIGVACERTEKRLAFPVLFDRVKLIDFPRLLRRLARSIS